LTTVERKEGNCIALRRTTQEVNAHEQVDQNAINRTKGTPTQ
jgi:hypothetical protein